MIVISFTYKIMDALIQSALLVSGASAQLVLDVGMRASMDLFNIIGKCVINNATINILFKVLVV